MSRRHWCSFLYFIILICVLSACNRVGNPTDTDGISGQETVLEKTLQPGTNTPQNLLVTPVLSTQTLTPHPITIGKGELMVVVEVVEKYYDDHGVYPKSITDLIPGYIAQLPHTFDGHEIWYKPSETQIYRVGFDPSERKYCVYLKKNDYLECGFRNPELFITWVLPTSTSAPSHTATPSPRQQSIQEMLFVVDAVEKYQADYGFYPESINELIPTYISQLPFTNEGYEIKYSLDKTRYIYMVIFWISDIQYCGFLKVENDWECGFYAEH